VFLAIGAWEELASFYAGGEESLDGMKIPDVMGCLHRGFEGPKWHLKGISVMKNTRIKSE
jgi:hypothetical protein